jgi:hypothetical protein
MSALADLLDFYGRTAWAKNDDGEIIPGPTLLQDRGSMARKYDRPSEGGVPPGDIIQANYLISMAEIAEAQRDLALAINMPPGEARNMKLGSLCVALQNAEYRIRMVTRS